MKEEKEEVRAPEQLEDNAGVLAEHEVVDHIDEVALRRRVLALQVVQDRDLHHRLLVQPAHSQPAHRTYTEYLVP